MALWGYLYIKFKLFRYIVSGKNFLLPKYIIQPADKYIAGVHGQDTSTKY